jgi:DNA primase
MSRYRGRLDFAAINSAALAALPSLLQRWLPEGKVEGGEYSARNPRRADRNPGSFKINLHTGRWADFATGDGGGDVISLAAYLAGISQGEAARRLAAMLGIHHERNK